MSRYDKHCTSCGEKHDWRDTCAQHPHKEPEHTKHREEHHHHHRDVLVPALGPQGPQGIQGLRGEKGTQGADGCKGAAGRDGMHGDPGPAGPEGPQGIQGLVGPQGLIGPRGEQGIQGIQGIQGETGETGKSCGVDGVLSADGRQLTVSFYADGAFVDSETLTAPTGLQGEQGVQGVQGEAGVDGPVGPTGPAGTDGLTGASGFVSKTEPDESGCFTVTFRNEAGDEVPCTFQECVTLLACGYTGTAICETPVVTGVVDESPTRKRILFVYPSGMTGEIVLEQTNSAATIFNVSTPTVVNDEVTFNIETDGKIRYNALLDKSVLPSAEDCTAPLDAVLKLNGLADLGDQLPQIQKEVGGEVTQLGFTQADNTFNLQTGFSTSQWEDDTPAVFFGGVASNLVGSMFTGNIDTFNRSTQSVTTSFSACRYTPVAVTTDVAGNFLSAVDASGNDVPEASVVIL